MPPARVLLQQITAAVLGLGGGHADSMRTAARWLAECGAAPKGADHYQLRDKMIAAGDHGGLQRYAYAYALAGDEARVRSRWNSWGAKHIAHFERRRQLSPARRAGAPAVIGAQSATTATTTGRYASAPGTAPGTRTPGRRPVSYRRAAAMQAGERENGPRLMRHHRQLPDDRWKQHLKGMEPGQ
jgi:hypothetical protein